MSLKTPEQYRARANVAKAMGHPTRMLILDALRQKEMCVCEITDLVGSDQSTVSRHLAVLKQAGLVRDRKEKAMVFYRPRVCCLDGFFSCIESVLLENLEAQRTCMAS